jgi:hypothetical protein
MTQPDRPGKLIYKKLTDYDIPYIEEFCEKCKNLGYENNTSLEKIKFFNAVFFGAYDDKKLISIAGVHRIPEISHNAWRCLFRGAQLPGYTPEWSLNIFKSGIHFSQFIYQQIIYVQSLEPSPEFYISTNVNNIKAGSSSRLNKTMMPRLEKLGYVSLSHPNFILYNTLQNVWKLNIVKYMEDRAQWINSYNYTDQK